MAVPFWRHPPPPRPPGTAHEANRQHHAREGPQHKRNSGREGQTEIATDQGRETTRGRETQTNAELVGSKTGKLTEIAAAPPKLVSVTMQFRA